MQNTTAPFWLNPLFLLLCTLGMPVLVTLYLPEEIFRQEWKVAKYFLPSDGWLVARILAAFAAGAFFVSFLRAWLARSGFRLSSKRGLLGHDRYLHIAFWAASAFCLFGSAVWVAVTIRQGVSLHDAVSAFSGNSEAVMRIREKGETIPGITTFTQFGMAAAVFGGIGWFRSRSRALRIALLGTIGMAFLRSFLRAERLAFIEVMVPFSISILPGLIARYRHLRIFRLSLLMMPAVAVVGLIGYFIVAESSRSYDAKLEEQVRRGPLEYGAVRLGGYYSTALNNGAYLLHHLPPAPFPHYTFSWLWRFPGVSRIVSAREITGAPSQMVDELLKAELNVEFNNPSGIFMYVHDYGTVGVLPVAFAMGVFLTLMFQSYAQDAAFGRLLYPMVVIGLLEISRYHYLTSSRAFPSLFLLLFVVGAGLLARPIPEAVRPMGTLSPPFPRLGPR